MNPYPLLKPRLDRIPNELRLAPNWVNWRAEWLPEKAKYNKPPINPRTLAFAKSTDPATWASFKTACQTYERNQSRLAGIGYVLTAGAGLVGIDIDHCIEEGRIEARAQAIIDRFSSYTELSPSGKGIRIFIKGRLLGSGRKAGNVEIYDRDRYLTLTGHALGEARPIRERQLEIDSLYEEISAPRPRPTLIPFVPSAGDFDMRNYARSIEGYHEGGGFGRAKCPAHQGEGSTSFHVNLSTGAYGCFHGCTTEAIRAAIGHPKPEPLQAKSNNGAPSEPVNAEDYSRILFARPEPEPDAVPGRTLNAKDVARGCMTLSYLLAEYGMPPDLRAFADGLLGASGGSSEWFEYADIKLARHLWSKSNAKDASARKRLQRLRKLWVKWETGNITIAEYIPGDRLNQTTNRPTQYRVTIWPAVEAIMAEAQMEPDFDAHPDRATRRVVKQIAQVTRLELITPPKRERRPQYHAGFEAHLKSIQTYIRKAVDAKKDRIAAGIQIGRLALAKIREVSGVTNEQILEGENSSQVIDSIEPFRVDKIIPPEAQNGAQASVKNGYVLRDKRVPANVTYPRGEADTRLSGEADEFSWEASDEANT